MSSTTPQTITPEQLQQHPELMVALLVLFLVFAALLVGFLVVWGFLLTRSAKGVAWLPVDAWSPRIWGFVDVAVIALLVLFWQRQSAMMGCELLGLDREQLRETETIPLALAAALGLGNVAAMFSGILWLGLRHRASLGHLGLGLSRLFRNLLIGVMAAFAGLPIVYMLMFVVMGLATILGMDASYNHPLLDEMKREPTLAAYLLTVLSAVLIAPVVEEFFFRIVIQGWLQSIPWQSLRRIFLGGLPQPLEPSSSSGHSVTVGGAEPAIVGAGEISNPFSPPLVPVDAAGSTAIDGTGPLTLPPVWPAVVTGVLFGLAHWGYGLSFIPLIALGIFLGLLYRATQSIVPSLVVHFALNCTSIIALGVSLLAEQATK